MTILAVVFSILRAFLKSKKDLGAENLCLRQQIAALSRKKPRLKLAKRDRIFWVWVSRLWRRWKSALSIVKPETVTRWHTKGFKSLTTPVARQNRNSVIEDTNR